MELRTPLPEALDRLSILTLKLEHMSDGDQRRVGVQRERDFYAAIIQSYVDDGIDVKPEWFDDILAINRQCWDLEDAIREGRERMISLEEVGKRALELRDLNKKRIATKNEVAAACGLDFFEIKIDHASE